MPGINAPLIQRVLHKQDYSQGEVHTPFNQSTMTCNYHVYQLLHSPICSASKLSKTNFCQSDRRNLTDNFNFQSQKPHGSYLLPGIAKTPENQPEMRHIRNDHTHKHHGPHGLLACLLKVSYHPVFFPSPEARKRHDWTRAALWLARLGRPEVQVSVSQKWRSSYLARHKEIQDLCLIVQPIANDSMRTQETLFRKLPNSLL